MAKKYSHDYFGIKERWMNIVLAIIPITSFLLGAITRFMEGKWVAGLLRVLLGWNIIWIADIVCICLKGKILRLLNV